MIKKYLSLSLFAILVLLAGCGNSETSNPATDSSSTDSPTVKEEKVDQVEKPSTDLIVDIRKVAGKSLEEVEAVLEKAENKEKVRGYPCKDADCDRVYFKNGSYEIIFKNAKADRITIHNVRDFTSNEEAIQKLGLPAAQPSFKNPTNVIKWSNVEGMHEVSFFTDYVLVQVTKPE